MNASGRRSRNYQIPSRFEDSRRSKRLPVCDIKFPARRAAPHQTLHDQALSHVFHYRPSIAPFTAAAISSTDATRTKSKPAACALATPADESSTTSGRLDAANSAARR